MPTKPRRKRGVNMRNLTIYIKDNSFPCAEAIDLASRIKSRLPQVELEIVNIDRSCDDNSIIVNEEPVFVLDHEVLHIGNPDEEALVEALSKFSNQHLN